MKLPKLPAFTDLYRQQRYHEILSLVDSEDFNPIDSPRISYVIGAAHFALGNFQESFQLLEAIEGGLATDAKFLTLFGATCRRLGMLERARQLLEAALANDPTSAACKNNYANLLIDIGEYEQAKEILESLLAEHPGYADARSNLNRLSFKVSTLESNDSESVAIDSGNNESHSNYIESLDPLVQAFSKEEVVSSEKRYSARGVVNPRVLQKLLAKLPEPSDSEIAADQLRLANLLLAEGRHESVLKMCSLVYRLQEQPSSFNFLTVSDAYLHIGKLREAELCLLHGIALGGKSFKAYINLSNLAALRGDFKLAFHYLDMAASLDPDLQILTKLRSSFKKQMAGKEASHFEFRTEWPGYKALQSPGLRASNSNGT